MRSTAMKHAAMKHPPLAFENLSPASLLQTVKEFARQGGGQQTIVAGDREFVLALTPTRQEGAFNVEAETDRVADLEATLLKAGAQGQREILARPDMLDLK